MARPILYYTFGNHMHWADMQWLWGYGVLPGSTDDMLALVRATGARGNVNFDAVGYEKMAAECPESLGRLREAVADGTIEPVGGTYGQPYGLFHGGESNIRQLTFGARALRRTLGVFPRSFWEEEFYFFPQLPQMLAQCGYTGACLFFQWTWHTPEIPVEPEPLIRWEGIDGTSLPALPRGELNVHQWPEDFDGLLDKVITSTGAGEASSPDAPSRVLDTPRAIVQWLELMPSPDWMCRSEILLPRLRGLLSDARFEVRTATISGLIRELSLAADAHIPARRYAMDDVWHGMTLGKNGDRHPRRSRRLEDLLVSTEAASAVASLFARPYAQWDLYPTWELEDSWRELLASQHHDNHECEGLCGHVAYATLDRVERLASHVLERSARRLLGPPNLDHPRVLVFNTTGRIRDVEFHEPGSERRVAARDVPPFGFRILDSGGASAVHPIDVVESDDRIELRRGPWSVGVCRATGAIAQVTTPEYPDGLADGSMPVARPVLASAASRPRLQGVSIEREEKTGEQRLVSRFIDEACGSLRMSAHPNSRGIELTLDSDGFICDTPGFAGSLTLDFHTGLHAPAVARDTPYSHEPANNPRPGRRKYPTGDWMTSPQWFEEVEHAFTSLTWVRLRDTRDSRSLVIRHDGSQQWFLHPTLRAVLTARDPWDEPRVNGKFTATFRFEPDGPADPDRPAVVAMNQLPREARSSFPSEFHDAPPMPAVFGPLHIENAPFVLAQAFFRESPAAGDRLPAWAGHRMSRDSDGACSHPFVVRLVEWEGKPAEVSLVIAGPVASAYKTNLLGEVLRDGPPAPREHGASPDDTGVLDVEAAEPPAWARSISPPVCWSRVRFKVRPREIATVYADIIPGRKVFRDLDAKREVWATVHRSPPTHQA